MRENYCLHWFAGVDFKAGISIDTVKEYDWFKALKDPPRKKNRISIITSTRSNTPFHKRRMKFIEHVDKHHSDVIDVFGRGRRQVGDKLEALLDYKYHIALENGDAPYTWTEKLADPLLAWTFPFHWGCSNADEELPGGAFDHIDINDPVKTVNSIRASLEKGIWDNALWMWTKASRGRMVELEKRPKRYPTDLTDEGWEIIDPLIPPPPQRGRRPPTDLREALNAPRYPARNGGGCCRRTFCLGRQSIGGYRYLSILISIS